MSKKGYIAILAGFACFIIIFPASAHLADTPWPMFHHDLNHTGLSTQYGPDTSTVQWTFSTGDRIYGSASIGDDGTIYIGTHDRCLSTDSKLYAIYPNGSKKWHWTPPSHNIFNSIDSTPAVAQDGTIYVGCRDRSLYALYPNGTLKWKFCASSPWWWGCCQNYKGFVLTSPAIGTDGTIYIGNNNHRLYAINPDGTLKWSYKTKGAIRSSPAVGPDGTIYVGSYDKKLYAIKPDGKLQWKYSTGSWIISSPAIGADGTIYIGSYDKKLYAINPNGKKKWKYYTGSRIISSPAVGADGTIYVGSNDKKLHAINPDGTNKWKFPTGSYITSSPAIDADGTIYVGSYDRNLYAINPSGTLLWKYGTGHRIYYSSPAIASDGTVYIGNYGGKLYAFGPGFQLNTPPVLDLIGNRTINETETLMIDVNATDPDGDQLTYSCNRTNLFMDFNPLTGTGNWTTDYNDFGIYHVDFGVSDGNGGIDNETIMLEVQNINRPPVLDLVGNKSINENTVLDFTIQATDLDGDTLTYSALNLPDGANFNPGTRTFSWTPTYEQEGTYLNVHFEVSDSDLSDWENITITVNNTNRQPVLNHIGDKSVSENSLLEFTVNATDPDGNVLTYSATGLPDGAVFNPDTRLFSWTSTYGQAGTYHDIHFNVSDSLLADWENITIIVDDTNRQPELDQIGDKTIDENSLLEFTISASDPDRDALIYSAYNLPAGSEFNSSTQIFSWVPDFNQAGIYQDIEFEVSDGTLTDRENITIVVNTTNQPPVLDLIKDRTIYENSLLEFTIHATDPDGDVLTYSASNLPDGAVFNPDTKEFSWTPAYNQSGIYPDVYFEVNDSELTDWESITITVNNTNRAPVLDPIGNKAADENSLFVFTINATDPDGNALSYSAAGLPSGAVFDQHLHTFSWTPTYEQAGTYQDIQFEINDGELTDWENITIEVANTNRPPLLDPIENKIADENSLLEFTINAIDPDGDALFYSAVNLPTGAVFDSSTQTISWTPDFNQAGTYNNVQFEVSDGDLTDIENISITVNNTNRSPVLDLIGNKTIAEDYLLEFNINAFDPDGDALTYFASNLPGGAVFNSTTQTFSWTPAFGQAGIYQDICFEITDGELTDLENITITVAEVAAPQISVIIPDSEVMFQQQFIVNITVDPRMNEIYGVQYILTFNNSVLHAEWQNEGTFLNNDSAETEVIINTIDNGEGTVSFAANRVGVSTGITTPGILAVIKFTASKKGECSDLTLSGVVISDNNGEQILPIEIINSSICIEQNHPPIAVGRSMHKFNNEGEKYPCKVTFNGTESYDEDGELVNWRWSFGDGNYGTGEIKDHIYHSWNWNGTGYDPFIAILTVTDNGDPHQLDENTFFDVIVYTAGDANGDGIVNILDSSRVGLKWMDSTICGAYCWEENEYGDKADLNNDCIVNILDAVIIGTCWGHTAWGND